MKNVSMAAALALVFLIGTGAARSQDTLDADGAATSVSDPQIDSAVSIPLPQYRVEELRKYEIPELVGAEPARGSYIVDGQLPKPFADYYARAGVVVQRVTLFQNGLASIYMTGQAGGTIAKKIMLPPDAMEAYRKNLDANVLASVNDDPPMKFMNEDRAYLRVYGVDGNPVQRLFDPSAALPERLERQRGIMRDLLRVLSEDRELSNPLTGYKPAVGDLLVSDDQRVYEITRLINNGEIVELTNTRQPLKMFVSAKDLPNYFTRARKRVAG